MKMLNSKNNNRTLLYAFLLSLFWVIFMWRFWHYGIDVMGINSVVYGLGLIGFFWHVNKDKLSKKSCLWIAPLTIIVMSMGIYTNPFTKSISLFFLPILFFVFSTHEVHKSTIWNRFFISKILFAFVNYLGAFFLSLGHFIFRKKIKIIPQFSTEKRNVIKQVSLGVLALLLLSFFIIIPLLSSVDSAFGDVFGNAMNILGNILESFFKVNIVSRAFVTILGMMFLLAFAIFWASPKENKEVSIDGSFVKKNPIAVGIILGGVLILYLIFIGLQIKSLFLGELPIDFNQAVYFVKTGFWQLFLLTVINILFYMGIYGKNNKAVQGILGIFTFASLLLILSGAHRTYLYVANYGLSYEKFYAFYTVIFCVGVFIWFISLFIGRKKNPSIFKQLAFAALWMYALTTIIPLERTILSVNFKLTQKTDSRVDINELRMLGFDALPFVEKHFDELISLSKADNKESFPPADVYNPEFLPGEFVISESQNLPNANDENMNSLYVETLWINWAKETIGNSQDLNYLSTPEFTSYYDSKKGKMWYEKTLLELIYQPKISTTE